MPKKQTLDLTGLKCPLPVLLARKSLGAMAAGDTLEMICTDPMAMIDIPALVQETGDHVEVSDEAGGIFTFQVTKRSI